MTQDINNNNPYSSATGSTNESASSESASSYEPPKSTVEQSVAYQNAMARMKAKEEAEAAKAQVAAETQPVQPVANPVQTSQPVQVEQTVVQSVAAQPAQPVQSVQTNQPATAQSAAAMKQPIQPEQSTEVQNAQTGTWTCTCGHINSGNFCAMCGSQRPMAASQPVQEAPQQATAQNPYVVGSAGANNPYASAQNTSTQNVNAQNTNVNNASVNNPYAQQGTTEGSNAWAPQQSNQPYAQGQAGQNTSSDGNQNQGKKEPDFSTGSFNFFGKKDEDEVDDRSAALKWGSRIGWFAIGFVGGIFGILIAWMGAASLSKNYRREAMIAAWVGLVAQAILYMAVAFGGLQIPFLSQGTSTSATSGTTTAGTSSSGSAFS